MFLFLSFILSSSIHLIFFHPSYLTSIHLILCIVSTQTRYDPNFERRAFPCHALSVYICVYHGGFPTVVNTTWPRAFTFSQPRIPYWIWARTRTCPLAFAWRIYYFGAQTCQWNWKYRHYLWICTRWYDFDLEGGFVPLGWFCRLDGGG